MLLAVTNVEKLLLLTVLAPAWNCFQYLPFRRNQASGPQESAIPVHSIRHNFLDPASRQFQSRLEALTLRLSKQLLRSALPCDLEEPPHPRLRIAVPRHIHRRPRAIRILQRHDRRVLARQPGPVVPEAAVVLDALAQCPAIKVRMENGRTVGQVLRQCALGAPINDSIAIRQHLRRALALGQQPRAGRRIEALDQLGRPIRRVEAQDLAAGGRRRVHLGAAVVLGAVRRVVVERDELDRRVARRVGQEARVVLEAEGRVGTEGEGRLLAVQPPQDLAGAAGDFVHRARVPRGDDVVAVGVFVDAVDVEVVPGVGRVVAGAGLAGVEREDGFCEQCYFCRATGACNEGLPSGVTWSRLAHSNSSSPVSISSSVYVSATPSL